MNWLRHIVSAVSLFASVVAVEASDGGRLALRTNLLYDAVVVPTIGVECAIGNRWSLQTNTSYIWIKKDCSNRYWRLYNSDIELRHWLGGTPKRRRLTGHHLGIYGAIYRYDFEFGGKGNMSDFSYGGGLIYGYSVAIGRQINLDFGLGIGYIGGKYKKYRPDDGCYLWIADKQRHYIGPTKAEVALVWKIGKSKRKEADNGHGK